MLAALIAVIPNQTPPYKESLRPAVHFTARAGWTNDPNGLVWFKGEYHLFFQHNPFGTEWGNMTWGHAVSRDLLHWKQLPEAIEPDSLGTIYSGSAVVDVGNTASFGADSIVCIYTAAGGTNDASKGKPFTQCIAYSTDGRRFVKYSGNPVLPNVEAENRDPKVIWYAPTKHWVMALYLAADRYGIFTSPDLKSWSRTGTVEIPHASECPDLFELPLDGDRSRMKWVFWGASGWYRVGSFDGSQFTPETDSERSFWGDTAYAAQTYFNDPKGRRVQISWMRGSEFPGMPWNQQMSFPVELGLRSTPTGPRLAFHPIGEIEKLFGRKLTGSNGNYLSESGAMDATVRLQVPKQGTASFLANGTAISYNAADHALKVLNVTVPIVPTNGEVTLRLILDRASIEIFAENGLVYVPLYVQPKPGAAELVVPSTKTVHVDARELRSIWK